MSRRCLDLSRDLTRNERGRTNGTDGIRRSRAVESSVDSQEITSVRDFGSSGGRKRKRHDKKKKKRKKVSRGWVFGRRCKIICVGDDRAIRGSPFCSTNDQSFHGKFQPHSSGLRRANRECDDGHSAHSIMHAGLIN